MGRREGWRDAVALCGGEQVIHQEQLETAAEAAAAEERRKGGGKEEERRRRAGTEEQTCCRSPSDLRPVSQSVSTGHQLSWVLHATTIE